MSGLQEPKELWRPFGLPIRQVLFRYGVNQSSASTDVATSHIEEAINYGDLGLALMSS